MIDPEEEKKARWFAELPQHEKDRLIKEANDARTWFGTCQRCGHHIEAPGHAWPRACPACGYGAV